MNGWGRRYTPIKIVVDLAVQSREVIVIPIKYIFTWIATTLTSKENQFFHRLQGICIMKPSDNSSIYFACTAMRITFIYSIYIYTLFSAKNNKLMCDVLFVEIAYKMCGCNKNIYLQIFLGFHFFFFFISIIISLIQNMNLL